MKVKKSFALVVTSIESGRIVWKEKKERKEQENTTLKRKKQKGKKNKRIKTKEQYNKNTKNKRIKE